MSLSRTRDSVAASLAAAAAAAAAPASPAAKTSGRSGSVMSGVDGCCEATMMISRMRGMPRVTLASPRPAWWKVLRVICVEGSPTDCAASSPTASPGCVRGEGR